MQYLPPAHEACEGYVFTRVCLSIAGGIPACLASLQEGGGGIPACLVRLQEGEGGIQACLAGFQVHTQGGSWGVWPGGVSGPNPREKLRDLAWGGLQAHTWGCLQAHTWGVSRHTSREVVSRPTPRGVYKPTPRGVCTETDPPMGITVGGTYPTWMHSCWNLDSNCPFQLNQSWVLWHLFPDSDGGIVWGCFTLNSFFLVFFVWYYFIWFVCSVTSLLDLGSTHTVFR